MPIITAERKKDMLFGKKRKKGPVEIKLNENQFCSVVEELSDDVASEYCIIADSNNYNLLYRDGKFMGMPAPFGGAIYPFATDPTKQGSNGQKKQFRSAKVVCLSKDFNLKVLWGTDTPFVLEDKVTRKAYEVGARGVFYVNIDPTDAARNADKFYSKCLTHRNAALFDTEALRDFLRDAFVMHIGAKIEEYISEKDRSLENYVGLTPSDILAISQELCPKMKDIFNSYGLSIVMEASSGAILQGLTVKEAVRA